MRIRPLSLLALPALALAAAPGRADAQATPGSVPTLSLVEPDARACRAARPTRARQASGTICVVGVASAPAGVAAVSVNGAAVAQLRPAADGTATFVAFVPTEEGRARVEVVMTGKGGEAVTQRYAIVLENATPGGGDLAYTITSLNPRLLGSGPSTPEPQVAQAAPPQTAPAVQPAAATGAAGPSATPAVASGAETPTATRTVAIPTSPAAPVPGDSAAAVPADAVAGMAEGPQHFVQIQEPREWAGVATRGLTVQPRNSVRVVGLARHALGVAGIEVNGVRASFTPDPSGAMRFVAYVAPDAARTEVEVAVRGNGGAPLVKRYPVALAAAPAPAAGETATAAPPAAQPVFRGKRWAVVVGVSEYQDPGVTGLRFADDDARAFYDFLRSPRAGGGGFAEENIKLILNEQATYREIRSALFTFLKGATEQDQVVIYFAGHGAPDPQRMQNLYLLTHDTDAKDISGTGFPMDDVNKAIRGLYARDILVITDACHSAGVGGQVATRDMGLNQINDAFLQQLSASSGGLAIFTASGANQLSQEDERWGGGHGVFTHYLLEGLNGAADEDGDRIVTLNEMMYHAMDRVRRETSNAQIPTISQTAYDPYWPMSIVMNPADAAAAAAARPASSTAPAPVQGTTPRVASAAGADRALAQQIDKFREAVNLFPRSAVYRSNLGTGLRQAGRHPEAIAEFQEAVKLDPGSAAHHLDLALTFRAAEMQRDAEAAFRAALRIDSRNGQVLDEFGQTLLALEQTEEAVEQHRRATRVEPGNATFHRNLGRALLRAGKGKDAVEAFRQAVTLSSADASFRRELAEALIQQGMTDDAILELQEASRIEPASVEHRTALIRTMRQAGQGTGAVEQLKQLVAMEPRNASLRHEFGTVLREQGMLYEMIVEFREAAKLEPGNALYRFELGNSLRGSDQPGEAITELREAVRIDASQAHYQNALGLALKGTGVPQDALTALREAVRLQPEMAAFHFDLGIALRELGEMAEALTALQRAHELDRANREYRDAFRQLRRGQRR